MIAHSFCQETTKILWPDLSFYFCIYECIILQGIHLSHAAYGTCMHVNLQRQVSVNYFLCECSLHRPLCLELARGLYVFAL